MKKKLILLPITLTALAPIAAITSCSNMTTFDLDKYDKGALHVYEGSLYTNDIDLSSNKWYRAKIDMSNCGEEKVLTKSYWSFGITDGIEWTTSGNFVDAKVSIDGEQLTKNEEFDPQKDPRSKIGKNEFAIVTITDEFSSSCQLLGGMGVLTNTSQIQIEFKIDNNMDNSWLFFMFGYDNVHSLHC